jgi:YndJ-like protein
VPLIAGLNSIALVAIVPIGLTLIRLPHRSGLIRAWLVAGGLAAISLWLPRGGVAVVLATPYGLMVLLLALMAARWIVSGGLRTPRDVAAATALVAPTVAATALLAERAGANPFGFSFTVQALTVAHFHAAGFAAALIAALSATSTTWPAQFAAVCVPVGLGVVGAGFFASEWVGVAGTAVLTAGLWLMAATTLRQRRGAGDRLTRTLFGIAAVAPLATMVLALDWALGRATGLPYPSVTWMAATHGTANLLGFAVCGLVAWRRLSTKDGADGGVSLR